MNLLDFRICTTSFSAYNNKFLSQGKYLIQNILNWFRQAMSYINVVIYYFLSTYTRVDLGLSSYSRTLF